MKVSIVMTLLMQFTTLQHESEDKSNKYIEPWQDVC